MTPADILTDGNSVAEIETHRLSSDESTDLDRMMRADLDRQLFGYPALVPPWSDEDEEEIGEAVAWAEIEAYRRHFCEVFREEFDRLVA